MPDDRFRRAEQTYAHLKAELAAGRIGPEQFEAALWDSKFELEGRYWMLGAETGSWYAQDGQSWVPATPPESVSAAIPAQQPPVVSPTEPATAPGPGQRTGSVLVGVLVGLVAVSVVGWLLVSFGYVVLVSLQEIFGRALGHTISALLGFALLAVIAWAIHARRRNRKQT
jgi:hypothetical protein